VLGYGTGGRISKALSSNPSTATRKKEKRFLRVILQRPEKCFSSWNYLYEEKLPNMIKNYIKIP
jgi:hypothetical protein